MKCNSYPKSYNITSIFKTEGAHSSLPKHMYLLRFSLCIDDVHDPIIHIIGKMGPIIDDPCSINFQDGKILNVHLVPSNGKLRMYLSSEGPSLNHRVSFKKKFKS